MSLARNQVYQGDCVRLLEQADAGSVDLVFADPPFNIGYEYDVYDDLKSGDDYLEWCRKWIQGVHRVLKPDGTFWLAIGDEYAAELKIESQRAGFYCRSWVIWYYTFGVNCVNGFSRSHTHLFHFVKDKKRFTFNRMNPQIRVKSARQLVYADNRANPNGRLPDNTWIIRPQDAPLSFSPGHDTWYFARVAGTFKEREGFHGCQMPEQLLARVIRTSSCPRDLVLDPFGGSGTTMCVAKKLGRQWMGFELSEEYVKYVEDRLSKTQPGDAIDGPEDPIQSAPATTGGKRRKKDAGRKFDQGIIEAYQEAGDGFPADHILCDKDLDQAFVDRCTSKGLDGNAFYFNRRMLALRKARKLPQSTRRVPSITPLQMGQFGFAAEVAWRLLAIDYQKTLDDILCSPQFALEFDRLAAMFGPQDDRATSIDYRRAALSMRKKTNAARATAAKEFRDWLTRKRLKVISVDKLNSRKAEVPGVFVLRHDNASLYAGESENIGKHLETILENPHWQELQADSVVIAEKGQGHALRNALKSALVQRENPLLNCRLWASDSELPRRG